MAKRTLQDTLDQYGVGLLVSEMGEAGQCAGNALRFGLDTPERGLATSRELLADEIGDILAAADWMAEAGVIDWMRVAARREAKSQKLRDPSAKTNDGRPIAPAMPKEGRRR